MKKTKIKNWIKIILLVWVVGSVLYFIWADNELKKIMGESTEIVDASSMVSEFETLYIKNVNILSEDCSRFIPNQDVVIEDGKILTISQHLDTIHTNQKTIDGTDKFLIPGLVDSHAHLKESKNDLLLYLVNGVTYIREMHGRPISLEWRNAVQKGAIGPRMFITSPSISSKSGFSGYFHQWTRKTINYTTEENARQAIAKFSEQGYDGIKMYSEVNPEMFQATINIAKEYNIPVLGHIPDVDLETFYSSGQIEIAHIEELTKQTMNNFEGRVYDNPDQYLEYLNRHANQIAQKVKENNIVVTSTIWLMESLEEQSVNLDSFLKGIELKYVNPKIAEGTSLHKLGYLPGTNGYESQKDLNNEEVRSKQIRYWNTYAKAVHIMAEVLLKNNVQILAGTDTNVAGVVPGFSMHDELESLTKSAMTNSQALYSATVAPNEWMKSNSGKIKVGFNSDLVLLTNNPLEDIKNTKNIEYVFFDKHMINSAQNTAILKAIEDANNRNRSVDINEFIN